MEDYLFFVCFCNMYISTLLTQFCRPEIRLPTYCSRPHHRLNSPIQWSSRCKNWCTNSPFTFKHDYVVVWGQRIIDGHVEITYMRWHIWSAKIHEGHHSLHVLTFNMTHVAFSYQENDGLCSVMLAPICNWDKTQNKVDPQPPQWKAVCSVPLLDLRSWFLFLQHGSCLIIDH